MDSKDYLRNLAELARVPEHSQPLMQAMSGGEPFTNGPYMFLTGDNWLMAIGYPLKGKYDNNSFESALNFALRQTGAEICFAIGPQLPPQYAPHIVDSDRFYILSANAGIPARLKNPVKKAASRLTVTEDSVFTPRHRRLWGEFMELHGNPGQMTDRVAELYTQAPGAISKAQGLLRLLDARDDDGNIAACLLLDYTPKNFISYILGAHSRKNYVPHASDLLFAKMLENARASGKRFIHLGLGVNEGILRFKLKWGAKPYFPYVMAQWETKKTSLAKRTREDSGGAAKALALAILHNPGVSARQYIGNEPSQKPLAMLWRLEKNGIISWITGTAHFFCHSFESSFRRLFRDVDTVIFEGPLDADFMAQVDKAGRTPLPDAKPIIEMLDAAELFRLEKTVLGPKGKLARLLGIEKPPRIDIKWLLTNARPWYAFFSIWTAFLERKGWRESVDMEAWRIARDMGKQVVGMETLEEQLESLGSLPISRVLRFFRACNGWDAQSRKNMRAYLAGDLEKMMGSSAEFPTRTEHVIDRRDQRFRERMRPYLESGPCAVFVGSAHMVNLRHMLKEDGFTIHQAPFGLWPKLHKTWRSLTRPDGKVTWQAG